MTDRSRSAPPVLLGASQAGASLTLASTAWMVSGLTASPLLNSLLPALGALPLLVPLRRTPKGYGLQLLAVLLVISQAGVPAWLAVLLFLPMGALAARTDMALVAQLERLGDAPLRWQVMLRSGAIGGVVGSIGLGVICQLLTLSIALPLVVAGFLLLAIMQLRAPAPQL